MSLLGWFSKGNSTLDWMRIAQELAITASALLRSSIDASHLPSARAEVRGYLRAKSTPLVRRALNLHAATSNRGYTEAQLQWLQDEATERTVRMSIDDMMRRHLRPATARIAA
ncbi:MAG: hypothetical protein JSS27_05090 [Planctomycetes bacterium]|nr:hypothetical protein [Planctomycetota bacterium]